MAPESQNDMIQLLAEDVRLRIIEKIKEASMFGVAADTTPDLSKGDQKAIVCRYVNAPLPKNGLNLKHEQSKLDEHKLLSTFLPACWILIGTRYNVLLLSKTALYQA